MNTVRETFDKSEKLCSRKAISSLFEEGNIFYTSIFKIVWLCRSEELPSPAQVAFSVSKRGFRLAVTRNLIKRRMREAYRKNKNKLYAHLSAESIQINLAVILRGNRVYDYITIENSIKEMIDKLINQVKTESDEKRVGS